jgi:host factor-I protein
MGGIQLKGNVRGFDAFTVLLDSPGKPTQLVYKHAITSVVPTKPIGGGGKENGGGDDGEG